MKFAVNDKAVVIYPENLQELQDISIALEGKEVYIGNGENMLKLKNPSHVIGTIRIECENYEILKKPGA